MIFKSQSLLQPAVLQGKSDLVLVWFMIFKSQTEIVTTCRSTRQEWSGSCMVHDLHVTRVIWFLTGSWSSSHRACYNLLFYKARVIWFWSGSWSDDTRRL